MTTGVFELERAAAFPEPGVGPARARLERVLFLSVGIAAVAYMGILYPGSAGIAGQTPQLVPWYGIGLIVAAVGLPLVLAILTWFLPREVMRKAAAVTSITFVVAMMAFPLGVIDAPLTDNQPPWFQGIHAVHGVIAALAWQRRLAWLYGLVHGVVITVVQIAVRDGGEFDAVLDGLSSFIFVTILMAASLSTLHVAKLLDDTASQARAQAASNAAVKTRGREESRINSIVHDDIMSVLLTAARPQPPSSLREQTLKALEAIESLESAGNVDRLYSSAECVAAMQDVVSNVAPEAQFVVTGECTVSTPSHVVTVLQDALAEALRNAKRHAGEGALIRVETSSDDHAIRITVSDNGVGFAMKSVGQRRLGIRLSIVERMSMVDGGSASIDSQPGKGTTVTLMWERAS